MNSYAAANCFSVSIRVHGDLSFFLRRNNRGLSVIRRWLREKTSVKDAIEACGIPHPEVDLILCDGMPVSFEHHLVEEAAVDVYQIGAAPELFPADRLQRRRINRFVADGHLGKLARDLRLLGFDVVYDNTATDEALLAVATQEERALLTRDRHLLMYAIVRDGYCPRSHLAGEQTAEVLRRFDLLGSIQAYSRCLNCNAPLSAVNKDEIIDALEPLTRIYYHEFRRCTGCARIYWPGTHFGKLQARIARICASLASVPEATNQKSEINNQK